MLERLLWRFPLHHTAIVSTSNTMACYFCINIQLPFYEKNIIFTVRSVVFFSLSAGWIRVGKVFEYAYSMLPDILKISTIFKKSEAQWPNAVAIMWVTSCVPLLLELFSRSTLNIAINLTQMSHNICSLCKSMWMCTCTETVIISWCKHDTRLRSQKAGAKSLFFFCRRSLLLILRAVLAHAPDLKHACGWTLTTTSASASAEGQAILATP